MLLEVEGWRGRAGQLFLRRLSSPDKSHQGFPDGSASKDSVCNVGDPGLIPGLGRSPGEGNSYLLQSVFWPGEFRGPYRPWGHKESDTTEQLSLSLDQTMGMDLGQVSICVLVLSLICYIIISEPHFLFLQNNNNPCS